MFSDAFLADSVDALDFAVVNAHPGYAAISLVQYAAGALLQLVGRREGGRTLRVEAVAAIAHGLQKFFGGDSGGTWRAEATAANLAVGLRRVSSMTVSDAK